MLKMLDTLFENLLQIFIFAMVVLAIVLAYVYFIAPYINVFIAWVYHFSIFNSFNPYHNQTVY